jgi:2-C-methyl-D-erythritol 4-phosphate cytidylyltransferase
MAVIIPCAGKSSRFPGTRPKYLLTVADGDCLFEKAAQPYVDETDVHFVILKEHAKMYDAKIAIDKVYGNNPNVYVHVLEEPTSGPAETVYRVAKRLGDQPIFIQDCDSFFNHQLKNDNHVCVVDLRKNLNISNVEAKSFAVIN